MSRFSFLSVSELGGLVETRQSAVGSRQVDTRKSGATFEQWLNCYGQK
ncbi:MAG: hypothetical protein IJU23_00660 [Proteobacteria bacterium]|nr:hypothetical protein [Pseudomonadota bacterium]